MSVHLLDTKTGLPLCGPVLGPVRTTIHYDDVSCRSCQHVVGKRIHDAIERGEA